MKKMMAVSMLAMMLAACGKSGAEQYVGFWQWQDNKHTSVSEIKQENGNYFVVDNLQYGQGKTKQIVLSQKDNELVLNTGVADVPLKLSEDGKSMFIGKRTYQKVDAATKDKIVAHQEQCHQLNDEYRAAEKNLPTITSKEYHSAQDTMNQQYFARFAELEKEYKCNKAPYLYRKENP